MGGDEVLGGGVAALARSKTTAQGAEVMGAAGLGADKTGEEDISVN